MRTALPRLALLVVLPVSAALALPAPAAAAGAAGKNTQIGGPAIFESSPGDVCPAAPAGFADYPALVLTGSLTGCWYTQVLTRKTTRSGVYLETGRELFVGSLDGGPEGTFLTTYRFESKFAPDGSEVFGRCQHPLIRGSGRGGFAGATGRVDYKDIIGVPVTYVYRGHIALR